MQGRYVYDMYILELLIFLGCLNANNSDLMLVCMLGYIHTYIYRHAQYVYICVCMYVYIYTHTLRILVTVLMYISHDSAIGFPDSEAVSTIFKPDTIHKSGMPIIIVLLFSQWHTTPTVSKKDARQTELQSDPVKYFEIC